MEYRKLGNSDLEVSVITFGAWAAGGWMWGGTDHKASIRAIEAAYDLGVTSIDTAPVYGQGTSEEIVREALRGIPRDKVQILTKFGMRWDLKEPKGDFAMRNKNNEGIDTDFYRYAGKKSIMQEIEDSLRRLKTDYIDLYQLHWPDSTTPIPETFEAVAKLLEQGKIRYAGVCNYSAAQMEEAEKCVPLASNQVPYSMVNRKIEAETVPYCIEQNKAILAYSPLERGLLTGKITPGYTFAEGDHRAKHPSFSEKSILRTNAFLNRIKPLAEEKEATLGQLVLRWTLEQPGITIALAGARDERQSVENAKAADIHLSAKEIDFINQCLAQR
ncbi:MAG: aldo/keto reductase [Bacteroidia bacterium]|nr:aldo/keto reductase [Bacteroidia bacterium]